MIKLFILFILISCSTTQNTVKQNKDDTTNTEFKLNIPSKNLKTREYQKKKVHLGEKSGYSFDFIIAQGSYWVVISSVEDKLISKESEVILNIKNSEYSPESISLVKIDENTWNGIGNSLSGETNIELIFKIPKKKNIIFNFDLEI
jgi:hypothetical protein